MLALYFVFLVKFNNYWIDILFCLILLIILFFIGFLGLGYLSTLIYFMKNTFGLINLIIKLLNLVNFNILNKLFK